MQLGNMCVPVRTCSSIMRACMTGEGGVGGPTVTRPGIAAVSPEELYEFEIFGDVLASL